MTLFAQRLPKIKFPGPGIQLTSVRSNGLARIGHGDLYLARFI